MGQLKILKQIFSKIVGQFDLEGQGQGHSGPNLSISPVITALAPINSAPVLEKSAI